MINSINEAAVDFLPFLDGHGGYFILNVGDEHILMQEEDVLAEGVFRKIEEIGLIFSTLNRTEATPS